MLVVFDWDGTLIDSKQKIVNAMHAAASRLELPLLSDQSVANIIGLSLPNAIQTLYPSLCDAQVTQMVEAYSEAFIAADKLAKCGLFDGVEECLAALEARGIAIAIATGKSRRGLSRMLDNLGWQSRFNFTRCADESASKPDPLMLQQLMTMSGYNADALLMVGDTTFDLAMANNAGIDCVAVSYGAHTVPQLQAHSPQIIIDNLAQLPAWIDKKCSTFQA